MHQAIRLPLAVLAVALVAAACGSASVTSTGSDDGDSAVSEPPSSPDDGDAGATRPVDGTDAYAIADLEVTITHPDAETVTYRISCLGDTASIDEPPAGVTAERACAQLLDPALVTRLVDGPADQACTEIYGGPDEAHLVGTLDGRPVDTVIDRANGCGISDWDDHASAVLPIALGVTG